MSNPNAVYLGRAIACTRLERGMKRKDLVAVAGISYPFLAEIENGKKWPSFDVLDRLAAALHTTSLNLLARAKQIGDDFPVLQNATGGCSKDSGRIKMIRGVDPSVRYVGVCDDCGAQTAPTSMSSAHLALNAHWRRRS